MSSNGTESDSGPLDVQFVNIVFDTKLKILPLEWDSQDDHTETSHPPAAAAFPSHQTFAHMANLAYFDPNDINCSSQDQVRLHGFTLLSAAMNSESLNGYFGVAYVNRENRQIVLSHRGTIPSYTLTFCPDFNKSAINTLIPRVASAITFAYKVLEYAKKCDYEVFYTGHLLGGWLAQITTFSAMYLTLDDVKGHFVIRLLPKDTRMPYPVVFDPQGALDFLSVLAKTLSLQKVGLTETIDVEKLPVDNFLFNNISINVGKFHVGRVFVLKDKTGVGSVDTIKYFGNIGGGIERVTQLIGEGKETNNGDNWSVSPLGNEDDALNSECRGNVPSFFLNASEQMFLKEQQILENMNRDVDIKSGKFEGYDLADEMTVSNLTRALKEDFCWKCTHMEQICGGCTDLDMLDFIPRVRFIVKYISRGRVWWNRAGNRQLPPNYVDRRMCPTDKLQELTAAFVTKYTKLFSATEVLRKKERLVVFVGQPGSGMSSAMTKLEMQLRQEIHSSPRVVLRVNLRQDMFIYHRLHYKLTDGNYTMQFSEFCVKQIPMDLLQQTFPLGDLPLYVILDGMHNMPPIVENLVLPILRHLLYDTDLRPFRIHQVILFTRPHLQNLIEDEFSVKPNSLLPLKFAEQVKFLIDVFGIHFDAEKSLKSLNPAALSFMGNPAMLSLYAEVLQFRGAECVTNTSDLHAYIVAFKHELYMIKTEPAGQRTMERLANMMECNVGFYFFYAVQELYGSVETNAYNVWGNIRDLGRKELLQPPGWSKLEELIEIGLFVIYWETERFKQRSFAEFFYAKLLTDERWTSKELRDVLLGRVYEDDVHKNVEVFVSEILLDKQRKRRESKLLSRNDSMTSLGVLREEDAALYVGKERLRRLVKGWLDCVEHKAASLDILIQNMQLHQKGHGHESVQSCGVYLINDRVKTIPGELAGATNKSVALTNFYNGNLFPVLCGWSILLSLEFTDQQILSRITTSEAADNIWWNKVVQPNFEALVGSTLIHTELVINLIQEKLITLTDMELLMDDRTPNSHRATTLYKNASVAWKAEQVETFKEALKKSGNTRALSILNSASHS